ncbi:MAG: IS66 family transposase zinc-finger binding domain-containing protein, partial [Amaricoccus sp.]
MSDTASEIARLSAARAASEARAAAAEADLARAQAVVSTSEAMIAKLRREQYGRRSERRARLIEQMELPLEKLETAATEEAPATCSGCGSARIVRMGEDVTETLEVTPRPWKVIQTVREKVTCRDCERISQPPAPFPAIPRGWAGPGLIAMLAFEKYG